MGRITRPVGHLQPCSECAVEKGKVPHRFPVGSNPSCFLPSQFTSPTPCAAFVPGDQFKSPATEDDVIYDDVPYENVDLDPCGMAPSLTCWTSNRVTFCAFYSKRFFSLLFFFLPSVLQYPSSFIVAILRTYLVPLNPSLHLRRERGGLGLKRVQELEPPVLEWALWQQ